MTDVLMAVGERKRYWQETKKMNRGVRGDYEDGLFFVGFVRDEIYVKQK